MFLKGVPCCFVPCMTERLKTKHVLKMENTLLEYETFPSSLNGWCFNSVVAFGSLATLICL